MSSLTGAPFGYSNKLSLSSKPKTRLGRKASIANANIIENRFFDETPEIKKNAHKDIPINRDSERIEIYNTLMKKHSKFETDEIFNSAPTFFKDRLGISSKSAHEIRRTSSIQIENSLTAFNSKKFSRHASCYGCSSKSQSQLENSEAMQHCVQTKPKPLSISNRSISNNSSRNLNNNPTQNYIPVTGFSATSVTSRFKSKIERISFPDLDSSSTKFKVSNVQNHNPYLKLQTEAPISFQSVFAVNGSLIVIKGPGLENFNNWFAELQSSKPKAKFGHDSFPKFLDFSGFLPREINMKLSSKRELIIEAYRPGSKLSKVKKHKEVIELPQHLSVEALTVSRTSKGELYIEITQQ